MDSISPISVNTTALDTDNKTADLQKQKVMKEFSTVITNQLFGEVLKDQLTVGMEDGMQKDFFGSLLVNSISEQLAETDALGLESFLERGLPK